MKVELIDYTTEALELLLYTKNTRLQGAQTIEDICDWPMKKKLEHLDYMRDTIQSSWEFVDYTFHISEVTRAFTHQLVRTRTGAYAQESQRTVDVRDATHYELDDVIYEAGMIQIKDRYANMIDNGVPVQEARHILPIGIHTSIIAKFSLRALHDMALLRLCTRTAGEYQGVFREMRNRVIGVHPWAEDFIQVHCAWYGVCAFPLYTECPIQEFTLDPKTVREKIKKEWEQTKHVAVPVAKDGRTM